jgi:hypothetical protein
MRLKIPNNLFLSAAVMILAGIGWVFIGYVMGMLTKKEDLWFFFFLCMLFLLAGFTYGVIYGYVHYIGKPITTNDLPDGEYRFIPTEENGSDLMLIARIFRSKNGALNQGQTLTRIIENSSDTKIPQVSNDLNLKTVKKRVLC